MCFPKIPFQNYIVEYVFQNDGFEIDV